MQRDLVAEVSLARGALLEVDDPAEARLAYDRHQTRADLKTAASAPPLVAGPTSAVAAPEGPPLSEYEKYIASRGKVTPTKAPVDLMAAEAARAAAAPGIVAAALSRHPAERGGLVAGRVGDSLAGRAIGHFAPPAPATPVVTPASAYPAMSEYELYLSKRGMGANFGRG